MCASIESALQIKAGPFVGTTQTDTAPQRAFQIIVVIALLVTNVVATLIIIYKTWYHACLFVASKS